MMCVYMHMMCVYVNMTCDVTQVRMKDVSRQVEGVDVSWHVIYNHNIYILYKYMPCEFITYIYIYIYIYN